MFLSIINGFSKTTSYMKYEVVLENYAYNSHVLSVTLTNTWFSMDIEIISKFTKKIWKIVNHPIFSLLLQIFILLFQKNSTIYRSCGVMIRSVGRDKKNWNFAYISRFKCSQPLLLYSYFPAKICLLIYL